MSNPHDSVFLSYYEEETPEPVPVAAAPAPSAASKVAERLAASRKAGGNQVAPVATQQPAVQRRARGQSIGAGTQRPMAAPPIQSMPQPVRSAPAPVVQPLQSRTAPGSARPQQQQQQPRIQSPANNKALAETAQRPNMQSSGPSQGPSLAQMRGQSPTQMRGPSPTQMRNDSSANVIPSSNMQHGPAPVQQNRNLPSAQLPPQHQRGPPSPAHPLRGPAPVQQPVRGQSPTQMRNQPSPVYGQPQPQMRAAPGPDPRMIGGSRGPPPNQPQQQRVPYPTQQQPTMRPIQQPQPSYRPAPSVARPQHPYSQQDSYGSQQQPTMSHPSDRPHLQVIPPSRPARTVSPPRAAFVAPPSPSLSSDDLHSSPEDGRTKPFAGPHSMSSPLLPGSPSGAGVSNVSKSSANYDNDRFAPGAPGAGPAGADFWKRFSMVAHDAEDEKAGGGSSKKDAWLNKQMRGGKSFKLWVSVLAIVILAAIGGALAYHFTHNSGNSNLVAPSTHDFGLGGTSSAAVATSTRSVSGGQARLKRNVSGFHKSKKRRILS